MSMFPNTHVDTQLRDKGEERRSRKEAGVEEWGECYGF